MSKNRFVTKKVKAEVNHMILVCIWDYINNHRVLGQEEIVIAKLNACPFCDKQKVEITSTIGDAEDICYKMNNAVNADVLVYYDEELKGEVMLIASEVSVSYKDCLAEIKKKCDGLEVVAVPEE